MAREFTAGEGNAMMLIPSAITDVLVGADGEGVRSWRGQCYDAYSECYYRSPGRG